MSIYETNPSINNKVRLFFNILPWQSRSLWIQCNINFRWHDGVVQHVVMSRFKSNQCITKKVLQNSKKISYLTVKVILKFRSSFNYSTSRFCHKGCFVQVLIKYVHKQERYNNLSKFNILTVNLILRSMSCSNNSTCRFFQKCCFDQLWIRSVH